MGYTAFLDKNRSHERCWGRRIGARITPSPGRLGSDRLTVRPKLVADSYQPLEDVHDFAHVFEMAAEAENGKP